MPIALKNAEESYQLQRAALLALEVAPGERRPLFHAARVTAQLPTAVALIEGRLEQATAGLRDEERAAFGAALEEVMELLGAASWAASLHARQVAAESTYPQAWERCRELQRIGFRWMEVLVLFGVLRPEELAKLREGRGVEDTLGDLRAMALLIERHWARLEPLQASVEDATLQLSAGSAAEMKATADNLQRTERGRQLAAGETDWQEMLLRATLLLRARWDRLRYAAAGGYAWSGQLGWAATGHPSIHSMSLP